MKFALIIVTWLIVVGVMAPLPQARGWRGAAPLHSTRADVERLLGPPARSHGMASTYDTKDERVLIFYSAGPCKKGVSEEWNVPRDTVLSITVHPNAKLLLDDLKLDKSKYERVLDYHVQGVVYYVSKEEGILVDARVLQGGGEDVDSITYEPAEKDSYLRCPGSSAASNRRENLPPPRKFDEYSNISFGDEKARLDNLAIYLQKDKPNWTGLIIVYAGRRARAGEAQARAQRAKNYLVKVHRIDPKRIVTLDGGHREQLEVEVYVLPPGISAPTPYPTVDPSEVQIMKNRKARNSRRAYRPRK